jgi:hypothetical protein
MTQREDDEANLEDLKEIEAALLLAHQAVARGLAGRGREGDRETFVYHVGFARGRLSRVSDRIYQGGKFGEAGERLQ